MATFRKPARSTSGAPRTTPAKPGSSRPGPVTGAGRTPHPDLAEELTELVEGTEQSASPRPAAARGRLLVSRAARQLSSGGRAAAKGAALGGKTLTAQLVRAAPRIPVRDLATLRAQHPEAADPEQLADLLVTGAVRASGALGAGVGAAAMLPVPPAMPVEIAAETLAVAAVEIKLIAELHEVYGIPAQGSAAQRAAAYLSAWAHRRGVDAALLTRPAGFTTFALSSQVRRQVRRRLNRSWMRRLPTMTPLLLGAGFGATLNRRDTRHLAGQVRTDLRSRRPAHPGS